MGQTGNTSVKKTSDSEGKNKKQTLRSMYRSDYKARRTLLSELVCGALAVLTTLLIWLFSTPM